MSSTEHPIYLDHNATAPMLPAVKTALIAGLDDAPANPASLDHAFGRAAATRVAAAGEAVGNLIGVTDGRILWTSGATESCNLGILGILGGHKPRHIISQQTEHPAVLDSLRVAQRMGHRCTLIAPSTAGIIDPNDVQLALQPDTALVSIMLANNETGALQPVAPLAQLCRAHGAVFHVDATQALGRIPVEAGEIDLLSGSFHKSGGPAGLGFLHVAARTPPVRLVPQIHGGGHQGGLRSGTLNAPAIAAAGTWAEWWRGRVAAERNRLHDLRETLSEALMSAFPDVVIHAAAAPRLPNTLCVSFRGLEAQAVLQRLPDVAASSGSACASALPQPSHVLRAMAVPTLEILGALRFSAGWSTTPADIGRASDLIIAAVRSLRQS